MGAIEQLLKKKLKMETVIYEKNKEIKYVMEVAEGNYHKIVVWFYRYTNRKYDYLKEIPVDLKVEAELEEYGVGKATQYFYDLFELEVKNEINILELNNKTWGV